MPKPETKFWHELKRITPQIRWTRLENTSVFGTPDLLGYNNNQHFFTVELKVTRGNSVRFSPHQIAFHKLHPKNSFIMVKHLGPCTVKLYEGSRIMELVACGLELDPLCLGLEACRLKLESLGAWGLRLGPVTVVPGPLLMDFVYKISSVYHNSPSSHLETNRPCSFRTCCPA